MATVGEIDKSQVVTRFDEAAIQIRPQDENNAFLAKIDSASSAANFANNLAKKPQDRVHTPASADSDVLKPLHSANNLENKAHSHFHSGAKASIPLPLQAINQVPGIAMQHMSPPEDPVLSMLAALCQSKSELQEGVLTQNQSPTLKGYDNGLSRTLQSTPAMSQVNSKKELDITNTGPWPARPHSMPHIAENYQVPSADSVPPPFIHAGVPFPPLLYGQAYDPVGQDMMLQQLRTTDSSRSHIYPQARSISDSYGMLPAGLPQPLTFPKVAPLSILSSLASQERSEDNIYSPQSRLESSLYNMAHNIYDSPAVSQPLDRNQFEAFLEDEDSDSLSPSASHRLIHQRSLSVSSHSSLGSLSPEEEEVVPKPRVQKVKVKRIEAGTSSTYSKRRGANNVLNTIANQDLTEAISAVDLSVQTDEETIFDVPMSQSGPYWQVITRAQAGKPPKTGKAGVLHFKCMHPGCVKTFWRRRAILTHTALHYDIKPYQCKVEGCDAAFERSHDLRRHDRIHGGTKGFQCACGKRFGRADALAIHRKRNICAHANEEPIFPNIEEQEEAKEPPRNLLPKADRKRERDRARRARKAAERSPRKRGRPRKHPRRVQKCEAAHVDMEGNESEDSYLGDSTLNSEVKVEMDGQ